MGVDIGLQLAPEIGQIRQETLSGRRALLGDVMGDIGTARGLDNPFIQARVRPFLEQQEQARRGAARRGVFGPLQALATNPFTQAIADQTALATRESQEFARGLLGDISGEGQQLLQQELELLGLGQQQVRDIIASQMERPVVGASTSRSRTKPNIFGSLFPGGVGLGFS